MRKYQAVHEGEVDLDDPSTYSRLPATVQEVIYELWRRIGYVRLYFFAHSDMDWGDQPARVDQLVREIAKDFNSHQWTKPLIFWQEKLFLLVDETENLC